MIRANLLHLSYNMWGDWKHPNPPGEFHAPTETLRFDEAFWNELLTACAKAKFNMIVIDLGDGVKYESHPEIGCKDAWSTKKLRDELTKLRQMGFEPIPKLNFSTAHDHWLGKYSRMVSTPEYYDVCRDLIVEVAALFDRPRFFHIGMDEENEGIQRKLEYAVIRQHGLWWRDLKFYIDHVESSGSRAWMWSDFVWEHPEAFYEKMSRNVVQSNWHYKMEWGEDLPRTKEFIGMEKAGFDQIPTLSNWYNPDAIKLGVEFCKKHISKEHLLGFLLTPWRPTIPQTRQRHIEAIERFAAALDGN